MCIMPGAPRNLYAAAIGAHAMKLTAFVKRVLSFAVVPVASGLALIPDNSQASQPSSTQVANVDSENVVDRISIVHSLLGDAIIPPELAGRYSPPAQSPRRVAQQSPPPVAPPPPP
jgi:hypothetical protein